MPSVAAQSVVSKPEGEVFHVTSNNHVARCNRYLQHRVYLTVSTEASAYRAGVYRGGVYRGGVYRGGYYRGVRPGVAVGIGAAAVGAAAVGAAAAGAYYAPAITALLPRSVVHTAITIMPPTTGAYPRHSGCDAAIIGRAVANAAILLNKKSNEGEATSASAGHSAHALEIRKASIYLLCSLMV